MYSIIYKSTYKQNIQLSIVLLNLSIVCILSALYPIDTIKTRVQSMRTKGSIVELFKGGNLYAGVLGNLLGVAPSSALFVAAYEPSKR